MGSGQPIQARARLRNLTRLEGTSTHGDSVIFSLLVDTGFVPQAEARVRV